MWTFLGKQDATVKVKYGVIFIFKVQWVVLATSVGIFPGTFLIFKSRDFWTSLVPGRQDHGTFKVSRSCPV